MHEFDGHGVLDAVDDNAGEDLLAGELSTLYVQHGVESAVDDVSGAMLDPKMVRAGRDVEMGFFRDMGVYDCVPRSEQVATGGKIIGTKWIDTNKGDFENPNIRCRLVGKEFRTGPDDALFASTPPLEALRLIVSRAATVDSEGKKKELMINDVSRAYFYAKSTRTLYVEIPPEDPRAHPDYLGRLRLCLYGTRDAALNWQETLSEHLIQNGFTRGVGHPAVFHHAERDIWTLVHGDDYCSAGPSESLDWMQGALEKEYKIKTQRIGQGVCKNGLKKTIEGQVLNRVIRSTQRGYELEADLRHAELIVEQLELQSCKSVITPGVDVDSGCVVWDADNDDENDEELPPSEATRFRVIGAMCNYLQPDRPDIQYAVKEVCRQMSRPTLRSWEMLKRIGRYLKGKPRLIWRYDWQAEITVIDITSDANWAGCRKGRNSTSGGTIMVGNHLIRTYSKTQSTIAKSSGESELYGCVRASTEGLGMATLLGDFGVKDPRVSVGMDASAAIGMAQRTGLNKVRHIEVDILWLQEQLARRLLPISKIPGAKNPSDLCTKNVPVALLEQYMTQLSVYFEEGRAAVAQQLHRLGHVALTSASPQRGRMPGGVIGGQEEPRAGAAPQRGTRPGGVLGSSGLEVEPSTSRRARSRSKNAADKGIDSWLRAGDSGEWLRAHRTPRRGLFTPHKVSGGPKPDVVMLTRRTTRGRYLGTGEEFVIVDDYADPVNAHRILANAWVGTTQVFEENVEEIDDNCEKTKEAWADMSDEENLSARERQKIGTHNSAPWVFGQVWRAGCPIRLF